SIIGPWLNAPRCDRQHQRPLVTALLVTKILQYVYLVNILFPPKNREWRGSEKSPIGAQSKTTHQGCF
ncbi:MAG: hypothetical protein P8Y72_17960, partial [Anaerolineales bacterium]